MMKPLPLTGTISGMTGCSRKKRSKPPVGRVGRVCTRVASIDTTAGVTASAMLTNASLRSRAGCTAAVVTRGSVCTTGGVKAVSVKPNWDASPSPKRKEAATERATLVFALSGSYIIVLLLLPIGSCAGVEGHVRELDARPSGIRCPAGGAASTAPPRRGYFPSSTIS